MACESLLGTPGALRLLPCRMEEAGSGLASEAEVEDDRLLCPWTPEMEGIGCPCWMAEKVSSQGLNSWPEPASRQDRDGV